VSGRGERKEFACNFEAVRSLISHLQVEACCAKGSEAALVYDAVGYEKETDVGVILLFE
jgi:hypothetical protein